MEPAIIASMINAFATIGTRVFEKWSNRPRSPEDDKIDERLEEYYDTLRACLTDHCVAVLKRLEDGQNRTAGELVGTIYPRLENTTRELETEFDYRLRYMESLGVVTRPTTEYFITPLGVSFLQKARGRKDFFRVLFS